MGERVDDGGPGQQPQAQAEVQGEQAGGGRAGGAAAAPEVEADDAAACVQGCQMAKFDPFLSLDRSRVEGVGAQSKERKCLILQRSVAEP